MTTPPCCQRSKGAHSAAVAARGGTPGPVPQPHALLLVLTTALPGGAVALKYDNSVGQVLAYEFVFTSSTRTRVGSDSHTVPAHGTVTCVQETQTVDDRGIATVRVSFTRGEVTSTMGDHAVVLPLALPSVDVVRTTTGNVLSTTPAPTNKLGGRPGVEGAAGATPSALEDFATLFSHARALAFPEREVEIGDSWTLEGPLRHPGGATVQVTAASRLTGVERRGDARCAVIQSEVAVPLDVVQVSALGLRAATTGKSVITVTSYFDLERGRLVESMGTERARRTVRLSPPGEDAEEAEGEATPAEGAPALQLDSTVTFTMSLTGTTEPRPAPTSPGD